MHVTSHTSKSISKNPPTVPFSQAWKKYEYVPTNLPKMFSTFFLNDTGNMGWIMDLGATDYVHSNKGILKTISTNHGIPFIYIGNGSKMPISITPPLPLQTCFALFILIIFL